MLTTLDLYSYQDIFRQPLHSVTSKSLVNLCTTSLNMLGHSLQQGPGFSDRNMDTKLTANNSELTDYFTSRDGKIYFQFRSSQCIAMTSDIEKRRNIIVKLEGNVD